MRGRARHTRRARPPSLARTLQVGAACQRRAGSRAPEGEATVHAQLLDVGQGEGAALGALARLLPAERHGGGGLPGALPAILMRSRRLPGDCRWRGRRRNDAWSSVNCASCFAWRAGACSLLQSACHGLAVLNCAPALRLQDGTPRLHGHSPPTPALSTRTAAPVLHRERHQHQVHSHKPQPAAAAAPAMERSAVAAVVQSGGEAVWQVRLPPTGKPHALFALRVFAGGVHAGAQSWCVLVYAHMHPPHPRRRRRRPPQAARRTAWRS